MTNFPTIFKIKFRLLEKLDDSPTYLREVDDFLNLTSPNANSISVFMNDRINLNVNTLSPTNFMNKTISKTRLLRSNQMFVLQVHKSSFMCSTVEKHFCDVKIKRVSYISIYLKQTIQVRITLK